jgi:hypothetical protein
VENPDGKPTWKTHMENQQETPRMNTMILQFASSAGPYASGQRREFHAAGPGAPGGILKEIS